MEHLGLTNLTDDIILGGAGNDTLLGLGGRDHIVGGEGSDSLYGDTFKDFIHGGAGVDTLFGGGGGDELTGGASKDHFVFTAQGDLSASLDLTDKIMDFLSGGGPDVIDLSEIDANQLSFGNQEFHFIGTNGFSLFDPGVVRYEQSGGNTVVYADRDGNLLADFALVLVGMFTLTEGQFVL